MYNKNLEKETTQNRNTTKHKIITMRDKYSRDKDIIHIN